MIDKSHVHEFNRISVFIKEGYKKYRKEYRWKCMHPDCHAMFKKHQVSGKRTLCGVCHKNNLILDSGALLLVKPRCIYCSESKENIVKMENAVAAKDVLERVLSERISIEDKSEEQQFLEDFIDAMHGED